MVPTYCCTLRMTVPVTALTNDLGHCLIRGINRKSRYWTGRYLTCGQVSAHKHVFMGSLMFRLSPLQVQ
jgi:hypothetical protein